MFHCFQLLGALLVMLPFPLSREAKFIGWGFLSTTVTHILFVKVEMQVNAYWMEIPVDNGNCDLCCESGNELKVNVYWMRIPVDNGNCHLFVASKTFLFC